MTRALNAAMLADIALDSAEKTELIEMQFAAGTVRVTTASQDLSWNGFTWEAVGGHLAHEGFGESADPEDAGCRVELSGVDQTIVALILAGGYRGRKVVAYHAHFNPATGLVIANPIAMFDGHMNGGFTIDDDPGDYGDGSVKIATRFTERIGEVSRIRGVRTNVHSHQATIPGADVDEFFKHVPSLAGAKVYWGMKTPKEPGPATPPVTPDDRGGQTRPGMDAWTGAGPGGSSGTPRPGMDGWTGNPPPPPPPNIDPARGGSGTRPGMTGWTG